MPHSTRNRKNRNEASSARSNKRTTVALDDGWSVITSKLSRVSLADAHEPTGPARPAPGVSSATLLQTYNRCEERWAKTKLAAELRHVVVRARKNSASTIVRALLLGLGSLSDPRSDSMWQLVMFLDIVAALQSESKRQTDEKEERPKVEVYAQDPAFNTVDEAFLVSLGIVVVQEDVKDSPDRLESPGASARLITPSTFVFAPHFAWKVLWARYLFAGQDPALYIGNDVDKTLDAMEFWDEKRDRPHIQASASQWEIEHERWRLPEFELLDGPFDGTSVYWRSKNDEDV